MMTILQFAAGIVLARILWQLLPAIVGVLFTSVIAVLAPITTIKWLIANQKRNTAPLAPPEPFDAHKSVERAFARHKQEEGGL